MKKYFKGNFFGKKSKKNFRKSLHFSPAGGISPAPSTWLSFFRFEAVRRRLKRFLIFQIYLVKNV